MAAATSRKDGSLYPVALKCLAQEPGEAWEALLCLCHGLALSGVLCKERELQPDSQALAQCWGGWQEERGGQRSAVACALGVGSSGLHR